MSDDPDWVREKIGALIPLVDIRSKPHFPVPSGHGGWWEPFLNRVLERDDGLRRLKKYEALGYNACPLSSDEVCTLIRRNLPETLRHLVAKYGVDAWERVFGAIRERYPEFGAVTQPSN